jgi:hypothetical protein
VDAADGLEKCVDVLGEPHHQKLAATTLEVNPERCTAEGADQYRARIGYIVEAVRHPCLLRGTHAGIDRHTIDAEIPKETTYKSLFNRLCHKDEKLPAGVSGPVERLSEDLAKVAQLGRHGIKVLTQRPPIGKVGESRVGSGEAKIQRRAMVEVLAIPPLNRGRQIFLGSGQQCVQTQVKGAETDVSLDAGIAHPFRVSLRLRPGISELDLLDDRVWKLWLIDSLQLAAGAVELSR